MQLIAYGAGDVHLLGNSNDGMFNSETMIIDMETDDMYLHTWLEYEGEEKEGDMIMIGDDPDVEENEEEDWSIDTRTMKFDYY